VSFEITPATPADRDRVVDTVVAAFHADPAFRFFFPDEDSYPAYAAQFTGYLFDRRVRLGTVWVALDGAVAALWDPPANEAAADAPPGNGVAASLPADVLERINRYDSAVHGMLPDEPHWYLGVLATRPDHAGRRFGRRLMAAGVTTAHAEGLPACLETTNPGNVELYRREGWEVLDHVAGRDVPDTWVLVSRPHHSAATKGPVLG
jgi:GNAT superfamily N-acetyltransferase